MWKVFILLQQKVDSYLSAVADVKGLYPASAKSEWLFVSCGGCEQYLSCFNKKWIICQLWWMWKFFYPASTESEQLFVSCGGCERSLSCFNRKRRVICQLWWMWKVFILLQVQQKVDSYMSAVQMWKVFILLQQTMDHYLSVLKGVM